MAYEKVALRLEKVAPMLQHNGLLADPMNKIAMQMKKITSKRNKTETDYEELAHLEWLGSLYIKDGKICVPGMNIAACFVEGAKRSRNGKNALAGVFCDEDPLLEYNGPTDLDELWRDENFRLTTGVKIQRNRVMRTRPMFKEWALEFSFTYNSGVMNRSQVISIMQEAGEFVGLGDWHPYFGRFSVIVLK